MKSPVRGTQILLISGTVLLTAALYLAPQFKSESQPKASGGTFTSESIISLSRSGLNPADSLYEAGLETAAKQDPANTGPLDSLILFWDTRNMPAAAAYYAEQKASKTNAEEAWIQAAYRYFDGFQATPDSMVRTIMVNKAIACYEKVIAINPSNLNAKTDLGVCYAEGTNQPMKGIMMLREVVTTNPEHENAQFNLGILSVRSGQYEKAIERFTKVLAINPSRYEMYFLIGKAYMMGGNKEKASENFETFKKHTADVTMINETNNLLNQLNNN